MLTLHPRFIQGKYDEAEPLCRRAMEITKRVLGEAHPDYATCVNNLASLLKSQVRWGGALLLSCAAMQKITHD